MSCDSHPTWSNFETVENTGGNGYCYCDTLWEVRKRAHQTHPGPLVTNLRIVVHIAVVVAAAVDDDDGQGTWGHKSPLSEGVEYPHMAGIQYHLRCYGCYGY